MLAIRLRRTGTTKRPYYRVVVADSRDWRDGRFVEVLGHYDPRHNPMVVKIDQERARYWISKGAKASDTVRSLLKQTAAKVRCSPRPSPTGPTASLPCAGSSSPAPGTWRERSGSPPAGRTRAGSS